MIIVTHSSLAAILYNGYQWVFVHAVRTICMSVYVYWAVTQHSNEQLACVSLELHGPHFSFLPDYTPIDCWPLLYHLLSAPHDHIKDLLSVCVSQGPIIHTQRESLTIRVFCWSSAEYAAECAGLVRTPSALAECARRVRRLSAPAECAGWVRPPSASSECACRIHPPDDGAVTSCRNCCQVIPLNMLQVEITHEACNTYNTSSHSNATDNEHSPVLCL